MENPFISIMQELQELKQMVKLLHESQSETVMGSSDSDFMQLSEAANLLGIAKSTLYKYSCSRKSPFTFYKVGKRLFCKRGELLQYMNESKLLSMEDYANQKLATRRR